VFDVLPEKMVEKLNGAAPARGVTERGEPWRFGDLEIWREEK
jgi:hypothetical protein